MLEQVGESSQHRYEDEYASSPSVELRPPAPMLDVDRRLDTLVKAVGEDIAQQFFWKAETGTIQTYEHRLTYRYVHVDSETGRFCSQQRAPLTAEEALAHALPAPSLALSRPSLHMALAPIVLEPDLLPFVRPVTGPRQALADVFSEQRALDSAQTGGALSRLYNRLRSRFLAMGTLATVKSLPDRDGEGSLHLQGSDLSLTSFTRRPA